MPKHHTLAILNVLAILSVGCGNAGPPADLPEHAQTESELRARPLARARPLVERENLVHGVAADEHFVFVTEPLNGTVAVHDRFSGRELGVLPPPEGGFVLPFTLRVPEEGRVVVLDAGGFPNPGSPTVPRVYDYAYRLNRRSHAFEAELVRAVRFDGIPVGFPEDLEVLGDGSYVMSDSILGSLWIVEPNGAIVPAIVPDGFDPSQALPELGLCFASGPVEVDGIPFALTGNVAPGVGSLAADGRFLYFANSCRGGIYRVPLASLRDGSRRPAERAADIRLVTPGPSGQLEVLKALTFNRFDRHDRRLYVAEPFKLRLARIDVDTGAREVLVEDATLLNFPVAAAFVPCASGPELVVSSDQEHRFAAINSLITENKFQPPFRVAAVRILR
jgi:hypothetical protein